MWDGRKNTSFIENFMFIKIENFSNLLRKRENCLDLASTSMKWNFQYFRSQTLHTSYGLLYETNLILMLFHVGDFSKSIFVLFLISTREGKKGKIIYSTIYYNAFIPTFSITKKHMLSGLKKKGTYLIQILNHNNLEFRMAWKHLAHMVS